MSRVAGAGYFFKGFKFYLVLGFGCLLGTGSVWADRLPYPAASGDALIGQRPEDVLYVQAQYEDTILDIARTFDIGQNEILLANPGVDRWLPGDGTKIRIPNSRLLPDAPHEGLILNLPEYRLYYFPKAEPGNPREVVTHPVSIGRLDWETPLGKTRIVAKNRNPVWIPPKSIREEHAADGDILPDVYPAGPDNPLGLYALRLGIPGYLIHSTNKPYGVGMRVSHGCIRMYPEDIERLFPDILVGTPVYIVNQPIKVGWFENTLYLEVHPDLEGQESSYEQRLEVTLDLIQKMNNGVLPVLNGYEFRQILLKENGIPTPIFVRPAIWMLEE
jgi:L,D-transpeptidase ErfK/SrfK